MIPLIFHLALILLGVMILSILITLTLSLMYKAYKMSLRGGEKASTLKDYVSIECPRCGNMNLKVLSKFTRQCVRCGYTFNIGFLGVYKPKFKVYPMFQLSPPLSKLVRIKSKDRQSS